MGTFLRLADPIKRKNVSMKPNLSLNRFRKVSAIPWKRFNERFGFMGTFLRLVDSIKRKNVSMKLNLSLKRFRKVGAMSWKHFNKRFGFTGTFSAFSRPYRKQKRFHETEPLIESLP